LAGLLAAGVAHADNAPTESDWGGTGLLQTPSAQMAPEGELAFDASHVSPYTRYNFTLQPSSAIPISTIGLMDPPRSVAIKRTKTSRSM
jgi:hypothetical protein